VTDSTPPGWYHAAGDPAGTHRYWDGTNWHGAPQPVPTTGSPGFSGMGGEPTTGGPGFTVTRNGGYPEDSQAVLALIISITGLVACCGLTCPIGWYLGQRELNAIDAGRRQPQNRGTANGAKIIGIIGTAIMLFAVVAYAILIVAIRA
jgi:hypothetical protein